jgi:GNAT superfamily N-acetyltransferase
VNDERAYAPRMTSPAQRALELLAGDPLRHIVSLKMLARLRDDADVRLIERATDWGARLLFPGSAFEYDARHYGPDCDIAIIEGNSEAPQLALLDELPSSSVVLKAHDPAVIRRAQAFGARPVEAFCSFTVPGGSPSPCPPHSAAPDVAEIGCRSSHELSPQTHALFRQNGYGRTELERYFADGARWFAVERSGSLIAACFVFRNFGPVWEIAGVHTDPRHRRQGLAIRVVNAAVQHLLASGARPRYQTAASNPASLELARRVGLVEFLRMEHLRLERSARV